MLTLIFGIWASEPPRAWRTTEKAGPDRVKPPVQLQNRFSSNMNMDIIHFQCFKRQIFNVNLKFPSELIQVGLG